MHIRNLRMHIRSLRMHIRRFRTEYTQLCIYEPLRLRAFVHVNALLANRPLSLFNKTYKRRKTFFQTI